MKVLITERFKFLISWLKKEGYFKTQKELGALCGLTNEATLSAAINGIRPNHAFVDRVCELDARINKRWLYHTEITDMLVVNMDTKNFANEQTPLSSIKATDDDKELAMMAKLVNSMQDTIATQKALITLYENEIKRLQRAIQFKDSERRAANALPPDLEES